MCKKTVGIQGIKGAFHEEAAIAILGQDISVAPCITFGELCEKVKNSEIDLGVIAIENTLSGTILNNLELIRKNQLCITHEVYLRIVQNIGALKGARMSDINEVHSHYMALNQCREFFRQYPLIRLVESADTALSVKQVAQEGNIHKAAIGSRIAIEHYGLKLLKVGIETHKHNWTRFAVISKHNTAATAFDKVSLSIELAHEAGTLSKVLSLLYILGINLTKIESVPIPGKPWNYRFYIDFILSLQVSYEAMIESLKPLTKELYIMGQYKQGAFDTLS